MPTPLRNYNGAQLVFVWGSIIADGPADGAFITIDTNENAKTLYIGTDGSGTTGQVNNNSATITVRLAQSSRTNDLYSAQYNLAKRGPAGSGILPAMFRDGSGTTIATAQNMWIQKLPSAEFGREVTEREWVFETDHLEVIVGGN